jgi:hypothetical protein
MTAQIRKGLIFFIFVSLALAVTSSRGQETLLPTLQMLQAQIDRQKELVESWETKGNVEFSLAMLVVVLGAGVALLQKVEGKKWCSYVVAASGIVISALTFATKEYFDVDHKTYRRLAVSAKRELSNAEIYLAEVNKSDIDPQHRKDLLKEVAVCISKVRSIEENVEKTSSVIASAKNESSLDFFNTAYAQSPSRPAWIAQARSETSTSYRFLGLGKAPLSAAAQSQALQNAQYAAATGLSVPLDTVRQFSILVDTYLEYQAGERAFICYVMVELNKAFVHR